MKSRAVSPGGEVTNKGLDNPEATLVVLRAAALASCQDVHCIRNKVMAIRVVIFFILLLSFP
jgi:hypothetical protein